MKTVIKTNNLTKVFRKYKSWKELFKAPLKQENPIIALENINIEVKQGEIFCLVGPNTAGKTTLIKILCGLILPTNGEVYVNDFNVVRQSYRIKSAIGLVSGEDRSFYWRLSGRQNLDFFASLYNLDRKVTQKRISELAKLLEVEDQLDNMFQRYSLGIRQRIGIIRSLLHNPKIIFMDEPTRSLDPYIASSVKRFIKDVLVKEENKTIIFATHNLAEAEFLADRIAILYKGRISACGSLKQLREISGKPEAALDDIFMQLIKKDN